MNDNGQLVAKCVDTRKPEKSWILLVLSLFSLIYLIALAFLVAQTAPCVPVAEQPEILSKGFFATYVVCRTTNELGDFLAGVFAPLAFLWLAGAVLIQSRELKAQKDELELTRGEMVEMRKVATAQADEARASRKFIGSQTKIMELQSAREELDDAYEELEARIKSFEACLRRLTVDIVLRFHHGTDIAATIRVDSKIAIDTVPAALRKSIGENWNYYMSNRGSRGHLDFILLSANQNELGDSVDKLRALIPKVGAAGAARIAEIGLSRPS